MDDDRNYLSWPEAAALVGCPVPHHRLHTRTGRIAHRPKQGSRPSLRRDSVEEFATWCRSQETERQARRTERQRIQEAKARHRARAVELGIRPGLIPALAPALILGISPSRVRQRASRNRLPHVSGQLSPSDRSQGRAPRS